MASATPSPFGADGLSPVPQLSPLASRRSIRATSQHSSPSRSPHRNSIVYNGMPDDVNSELSHLQALQAAKEKHDQVRQAAIDAFDLHELREQTRKEEERINSERALVAEHARLARLKATEVPKPPPPPPEPPKVVPAPAPAPTAVSTLTPAPAPSAVASAVHQTNGVHRAPTPLSQPVPSPRPTIPSAVNGAATHLQIPQPMQSNISKPVAAPAPAPAPAPTPAMAPAAVMTPAAVVTQPKPAARPAVGGNALDRHQQIHLELKKLRRSIADKAQRAKQTGSPLGAKLGDMRRTLRKSMGQFTSDSEANRNIIRTLDRLLMESLNGSVPSDPVDVSLYIMEPREPIGGPRDGPLPELFVYLLNMLSKFIIAQLATECGAKPEHAERLGVATATIFSQPEFQWRGKSLIDIFISKFRVACPVLFGIRGSERTEEGRKRLGWWKRDGTWVPEQMHSDRMTGLGAGFASIALRKFGAKGNRVNPYPPFNYWRAMADIVNTPTAEISGTQCIVLKSMIQGHEERFLMFFGNAGLAALRVALVDFPNRAPKSTQAMTLTVLAEVLKKDKGLVLSA